MLALMLPCLGAWAEVAQPETGVYVISGDENGRRGNLAACQGITNFPALSNINWPGQNYHNNSVSAIKNGEHWYVLKVANRYVIYNLGINKYLVKEGNNINFGDTPYLWEVLVNGEYNSIYDEAGTYISFQCGKKPNTTTRNINFNNSFTDGGSWHTFTTVADGATTYAETINTVNANAPEELSCELTDEFGNVYTGTFAGYANVDPSFVGISMSSPKWENKKFYANIAFTFPVSNAAVKNQVTISPFQGDSFKYYVSESNVKVTSAASVTNHLWEIYPSFTNGEFVFQIKNVATDKYIVTALGANTNPAEGNVKVTDSEGTLFTFSSPNQFRVKDKCVYLSTHSSSTADQWATVWGTHSGTKNKITTVNTIYNRVNYILTDIAGNTYTINNVEGTVGDEPVFTGADGYTLENGTWNRNTFTATITFTVPVSSQTVINPVLIRQGSWNYAAKKWCAVKEDGVYNVKVVTTAKDEEAVPELGLWQWVIYPKFDNGNFTFNIMNAATGTYVYANPTNDANAEGSKGYVTLNNIGTDFTIVNNNNYPNFAYKNNKNTTLKFTINSENDTNVYLGAYTGTHAGNNISFPNLTSFNVKVGSTGYASLYTPIAGTFEEGVETYAVTEDGIKDGYVSLTLKDGVAANQGVIVKANEGTYTFTIASDVTTDWEDNLLEGTSVNTMIEGDAYVLGNVDGIGLYKAKLTDGFFLNNAGKAYLPITTTAQVLRFNFGGTTGIEDAIVAPSFDANAPIFDLSGRRVMNTVKGGIYIQNGKKFIVK